MAEDPQYNKRLWRSFMCLRVLLDLRKPLVEGFWILKPDKSSVWVSVKYEKLQDFSYRYGNIAHNFHSCNKQRLLSCVSLDKPRYGNWTTIEQVRTWEDAVVKTCKEWPEVNMKWKRQKEEWKNKENVKPLVVEDVFVIGAKVSGGSMKLSLVKEQVEKDVNAESWDKEKASNIDAGSGTANWVSAGLSGREKVSGCNVNAENTDKAEDILPYHSCMKGSELCREGSTEERGDEKAIVVYVEKGVQEIASAMGELKLKREAVEELESSVKKKRRVCDSGPEKPEQISTFIRYLRTKTKARTTLVKKGSGMEGNWEGKEKEKGVRRSDVMLGEAEGMGG